MKIRKRLSMFLIGTMFLMNCNPVYASDSYTLTQEKGTNFTQSVSISCPVPEIFTVTIPKSISIDANTSRGSFTVKVSGYIKDTKRIDVYGYNRETGKTSFMLSCDGQELEFEAIGENNAYPFECCVDAANINTGAEMSYNGRIAPFGDTYNEIAPKKMPVGNWTGSFDFTISLSSSE